MTTDILSSLENFFGTLPGIDAQLDTGPLDSSGNGWWLKFYIDQTNPNFLEIVQDLAHVLNYRSKEQHVPVRFMPVSPTGHNENSHLNKLLWIIECNNSEYSLAEFDKWLKSNFE